MSGQQLSVLGAGAKIAGIAAGEKHSLAVTASGELLSWGCGSRGQLGHGATAIPANRDEFQPRLISSLKGTAVQTAAAGVSRSGLQQRSCRALRKSSHHAVTIKYIL